MLKNVNLTKVNNLKKQRVIRRIFISGTVCTFLLAVGCCVQIHRVNSYRFNEPLSMTDKQAETVVNFIDSKVNESNEDSANRKDNKTYTSYISVDN